MASEFFERHGCKIELKRQGMGWVAFVTLAGSRVPLADPPYSPNQGDRGLVLAKAEAIIDRWLKERT
jgi:hypothetical protein